jgi:hypothetical protein
MCIFQTTLKTLQTEFEYLIQKLHRNTLYMLSRKDMFLQQEPNKIGFAFFYFSTIFNDFSKFQLKTLKYIYRGTLGNFSYFTSVPFLYTKHPEQIAITAICSPGGSEPRRRRDWRLAAAGLGRRTTPEASTDLVWAVAGLDRAWEGGARGLQQAILVRPLLDVAGRRGSGLRVRQWCGCVEEAQGSRRSGRSGAREGKRQLAAAAPYAGGGGQRSGGAMPQFVFLPRVQGSTRTMTPQLALRPCGPAGHFACRDAQRGMAKHWRVAGRSRGRAQTRSWAWCTAHMRGGGSIATPGPPRRCRGFRTPEGRADTTWMAHGQRERGGSDAPGTAAMSPSPIFLFREAVFKIVKLQKVSTNLKISKYKSCRGAIDLQLSQRASYVLINGLSGNVGRSWQNSRPQLLFTTRSTRLLANLHSKLECPPITKNVFPEITNNFHIGRF